MSNKKMYYVVVDVLNFNTISYKKLTKAQDKVRTLKGATIKKFKTEKEAIAFNKKMKKSLQNSKKMTNAFNNGKAKDILFGFVDGSCTQTKIKNCTKSIASYGICMMKNYEIIYTEAKKTKKKETDKFGAMVGELESAIKAVEYAIKNKYKEIVIVHDYEGIQLFVDQNKKIKHKLIQEYRKIMRTFMQKIKIHFLKVKAHSGNKFLLNKYNNVVDKLAKQALGI